jgi:hypothetical protein
MQACEWPPQAAQLIVSISLELCVIFLMKGMKLFRFNLDDAIIYMNK